MGIYILLSVLIVLGILNVAMSVGMGLFLLRLGAGLKQNRENTASSIQDIADTVHLMRGNMEDFKNFIRSVTS